MSDKGTVTALLQDWQSGNPAAFDRLVPLVYQDLKRIAARRLALERGGHTLQPTALVHEAYLRLGQQKQSGWRDRAHFFALSASLMRRILIDHARRRRAKKRVAISAPEIGWAESHDRELDLLALDEVLERLSTLSARQARIVELRVFGGLTVVEVAAVEGVSRRTVQSDWRMARAWLVKEFARG